MATFERPKDRILCFMSFIYLFSFSSLYIQLPGLFSRNGILPVDKVPLSDAQSVGDFLVMPNLLRLGHLLNLDKYDSLELITVLGAFLSLIAVISSSFRSMSTFAILWMCHFACYSSGQVFLHFQWDILLLEAGFLAILLARADLLLVGFAKHVPSDSVVIFLFKWLLFRLMFASGVVKLTSECPSWWGLKALNYHFETQCLPTPFAFYAQQLPEWILKLGVVTTFYIEIIVPIMFFMPLKALRLFSFYSQLLLQFCIILTGNYNFFNLLTITLCYSLLNDSDFGKAKLKPVNVPSSSKKNKKQSSVAKPCRSEDCSCVYLTAISHVSSVLVILASLVAAALLFNLQISGNVVNSSISFDKKQFSAFVSRCVLVSGFVALFSFFVAVYSSLKKSLASKGIVNEVHHTLGTIIMALLGSMLLFASIHVFSASLAPGVVKSQPSAFGKVYSQLMPYQVTNSYGLFRRMTTVRNEVTLEMSDSENGPWTKIHFPHKPGSETRMPSIVVPHQPRLDWQMWFVALSSADEHPWIYSLLHGILEGRPEVLGLLEVSHPFTKPKFVRASIEQYKFGPIDPKNPWQMPAKWWVASGKASQYLPLMSVSSKTLKDKLSLLGIHGTKTSAPSKNSRVSGFLWSLRARIGQPKNLHPLVAVLIVLLLTKLRRC